MVHLLTEVCNVIRSKTMRFALLDAAFAATGDNLAVQANDFGHFVWVKFCKEVYELCSHVFLMTKHVALRVVHGFTLVLTAAGVMWQTFRDKCDLVFNYSRSKEYCRLPHSTVCRWARQGYHKWEPKILPQ